MPFLARKTCNWCPKLHLAACICSCNTNSCTNCSGFLIRQWKFACSVASKFACLKCHKSLSLIEFTVWLLTEMGGALGSAFCLPVISVLFAGWLFGALAVCGCARSHGLAVIGKVVSARLRFQSKAPCFEKNNSVHDSFSESFLNFYYIKRMSCVYILTLSSYLN